jgi:hypothetical protein
MSLTSDAAQNIVVILVFVNTSSLETSREFLGSHKVNVTFHGTQLIGQVLDSTALVPTATADNVIYIALGTVISALVLISAVLIVLGKRRRMSASVSVPVLHFLTSSSQSYFA